jgi:folate-binding Fe-S cluster repair protein YgfZ
MLCRISDRKLLKLSGPDVNSILKGLTTSNVNLLFSDPDMNIQHTLFLNTKGRIITDSFLIKPLYLSGSKLVTCPGELWLEAYNEHSEELTEHIKRHAFRKQIKIDDISENIDTLCLFVDY